MKGMTLSVLVVDNNPVLLKAITAILAQEGCSIKAAENGLQALELLQDYSPDIVFTDLIMPQVSGEQLCRILRNTKKHESVFIVVLSAIILEDRERILKEIQCDECIAKGNIQEIREHIREVLKSFALKNNANGSRTQKKAKIPEGLQPSGVASELLSDMNHLTRIMDNLEEGVVELNGRGKIISANRAALEILSLKEEHVIGTPLAEIIDWLVFYEPIKQWVKKQVVQKGMQAFEILEDNPLLIHDKVVTSFFLPVAEKKSVFGLCILRDISRQYKAEKHNRKIDGALRLVKKMDAMSCMAGGVAHDFNNLLTVICGNLDIVMLRSEKEDCEDRKKLVEQARTAALTAVDLTRQISCFSNFGITSREKINAEQLIREAVALYFENKKHKYIISSSVGDYEVSVDKAEIEQVISNILQNSLEASDNDPIKVTIASTVFTNPQLMYGQYVPIGEYVQIDIEDTGNGIDSEELLKIFDPYYSTKERSSLKGMGLGLTIVYSTIRNHGGYVVVHSRENIGTTVSLYLPVYQNSETIFKEDPEAKHKKRSILLIESDQQMVEIGRIMLGYLGFSVETAKNRAQAVKKMEQFYSDQQLAKPLVLLDISSSNGESGVETRRILHAIDPDLKIIAMSGTILDPIMENCIEYGFVNALPKPYSMDSLKHILSGALFD